MTRTLDTYKLMQGIEKYVVGGAIAGLSSVVWHDDPNKAFTDGTTIHLPRPNSLFTDEELLLWRYKAEHELGHEDAVNSNPHWKEVMKEKRADARYKDDGLLWWLANLISDHVQEHNRVGEMAGRDEVLLKGRQFFLKTLVFKAILESKGAKLSDDDVRSQGIFLWDTRARKSWNPNIEVPSLSTDVEALADKIEREAGVVLTALKDEAQVFEAACKVRKLFPEVPQNNNFQNAKPDSGDEEGNGKKGEGKEGAAKKGGKADSYSKVINAKSVPFTPTGMHGVETEVGTYVFKDSEGRYAPRSPSTLAKCSRTHSRSCSSRHIEIVKGLLRRTNLPAKVRSWLMAQKREKFSTGWRSGRLDTNRLTDVLRGKDDMFRRKDPILLVDSAVSLLVDSSGSMSGSSFEHACAAALMLAEALQGIKVSIEIAGFTEFGGGENELIHDMWLPFGRRYVMENVLKDMSKMSENLASNADGENILYAYNRLKQQNQERKILIVLSDGQPAACGPAGATCDIGAYTKRVIKEIEKDKSVVLIGLGMSGYAPDKFYKNAFMVKHGEALEPVLLNIVKNGVLR